MLTGFKLERNVGLLNNKEREMTTQHTHTPELINVWSKRVNAARAEHGQPRMTTAQKQYAYGGYLAELRLLAKAEGK